MIVLGHNIQTYANTYDRDATLIPRWDKAFVGATPYSFHQKPPLAVPREPELPLVARDPYGVTGVWMRVVCFLDYNDLFGFNFLSHIPADQPRHPLEKYVFLELKFPNLYSSWSCETSLIQPMQIFVLRLPQTLSQHRKY